MDIKKKDANTIEITTTTSKVEVVSIDDLQTRRAAIVDATNNFITTQQARLDDIDAKITQATSLGVVSKNAKSISSLQNSASLN